MPSEALNPQSPAYDPVFAARVAQAQMRQRLAADIAERSAQQSLRPYQAALRADPAFAEPWRRPQADPLGAVTPATGDVPMTEYFIDSKTGQPAAPPALRRQAPEPIVPEIIRRATEPDGFDMMADVPAVPAVPDQPEESIEDLRARLGFSWGKNVALGPNGRPLSNSTVGRGSLAQPRTVAHESTGGGGLVLGPDPDALPPGQRPPSYWQDKALDLAGAESDVRRAAARTALGREQPSTVDPRFTVGEELASQLDPKRAQSAEVQSVLAGVARMATLADLARKSGDPATIAAADEAYQRTMELAKLALTGVTGRNLGFYGGALGGLTLAPAPATSQ